MKKIRLKLLFSIPLLYASTASAGVDCDGVPHTRLELAVCGEPVLRALDSELTAALKEAHERGVIDRRSMAAQRNQIARQCRREAADAFNACLIDAELKSLVWAASKLGRGRVGMLGNQGRDSKSWRYDASLAYRTAHLKKQLTVAESRLRSTGDPELTVLTLLSLIGVYTEQQDRSTVATAIGQIERRLAAGCDHVVYGRDWRDLLVDNNLSCADLRQSPFFSSADF